MKYVREMIKNHKVLFIFVGVMVLSKIAIGQTYPYCEFGKNPYNPDRQLSPDEVWVQLPEDFGPIISYGGANSWSSPCIIQKGTLVAAKKTAEEGRYCKPWAAICGNPIVLPNGQDFCFRINEGHKAIKEPAPSSAQSKEQVESPVVKIEPPVIRLDPPTLRLDPSTLKIEMDLNLKNFEAGLEKNPEENLAKAPPEKSSAQMKKESKNKKVWAILGGLALGLLVGYLLSQSPASNSGSPPSGDTTEPGGSAPGGETN